MTDAESALPKLESRKALATVCGILFLTFLDTTILSVALADFQETLHAGVTQMQWIVNSYALVFASFMLAAGTLGDRVGRKKVMLAGVGVFAAGSLFGALAPNVPCVIAARTIMGVGAAASEPGTLSILRHVYPDHSMRARALGVWAAIAGLALAMGPVIGGVLVGAGGWRAIFWFNLAAAVLALALAWRVVPESADPRKARFDWGGFILGPVSLGTIVFAIILGETAGYRAPHVLALFAIGVVAAGLFVLVEQHVAAPMLQVRYLRKPAFSGSLAIAFAAYFGVFSIFFLAALYLQIVIGYSAFRTAALFAPMATAMIFASVYAGRWVARVGPRLPLAVGCVAAGVGTLLADLSMLGDVVHFWPLALSLVIAGFGFGIAVVPVTSVALAVVPARYSGMAASATTTAREVGSVIGVAVLGSLFNSQLLSNLERRLVELSIPNEWHQLIKDSVLKGTMSGDVSSYEKIYGSYAETIDKVVTAAYDAVHVGVTISLVVAGCVILGGGIVAWLTMRDKMQQAEEPEARVA